MTKHDIIVHVAQATGLPQSAVSRLLQELLGQIVNGLAEGKTVTLRNFGSFTIKCGKARIGRNPRQPDIEVAIPARAMVKFRPAAAVRKRVRQSVAPPA